MQIILLSGGSGSRLWPLSNDARSKQFLKVLPGPDGERESMIQRIIRQLRNSPIGKNANITVATSISQRDAVVSQLNTEVSIVTEPSRRKTFPAICLACEYLKIVKGCSDNEPVLVIPCDAFTDASYFDALAKMIEGVEKDLFRMIVMGVKPTYPSTKYGYVVPDESTDKDGISKVKLFTEKPDSTKAEKLIERGALWNGGVFAFRLKYVTDLSDSFMKFDDFKEYVANYDRYPKISFDYEVAEKASSVGVVTFDGNWKDLGTWNTLTDEAHLNHHGNVVADSTTNTHIFNELTIPLLCVGVDNMVIAASPDGILVADKTQSEKVKDHAEALKSRPMYEERRWGTYKVIDYVEFPDKFHALTKQLTLMPGGSISYQRHSCRDEVWTFIDGQGEIVLDGERKPVCRGDVINIPKGMLHALKANTSLTFIEVQHGSNLVEEDIERFPYEW